MILDKFIASQRPSTRKMAKYDVIPQMLKLNIGAIFNLQEPGEHALCADGIDDKIGFSYNPDAFNEVGIAYHNFYWQDLKVPPKEKILTVCQAMMRFHKMGKRIFVHCHAGTGRTATVICCFIIFCGMITNSMQAVKVTKESRTKSLPLKKQVEFVV